MTSATAIPQIWGWSLRIVIFLVLEGAAGRLAAAPSVAGRRPGVELLFGLLALAAVVVWPGVAALGAHAILSAPEPTRWRFGAGLRRSFGGCLAVLPYLGAPLVALGLALPRRAGELAAFGAAYLAVAAALGCLIARGAAPWGLDSARRFLVRSGALFAFSALFLLRAWQPELTLAPLFTPSVQLVFPFDDAAKSPKGESGRGEPARPVVVDAPMPRYPIPALQPTQPGLTMVFGMALCCLVAAAALWRVPPVEGRDDPALALPDFWGPLAGFAGALGLLVLDAGLLPELTGRGRALALAADEALLLGALGLVIAQLDGVCPGRSYGLAAAGATCLAGAAALGQDVLWIEHTPITIAFLVSLASFGALVAAGFRALPAWMDAPTAWGVRLVGATALGFVFVITDGTYTKIALRYFPRISEMLLVAWLVVKLTLTALSAVAAYLVSRASSS